METSLNIIIFLIGTIVGMFFHNLWIKSEVKKKRKRIKPDWCGDKNNCENHFCETDPNKCEYDIRDLL